jgi:hypothetical protein
MYLTKNVYCYIHVLLPILRCDWVDSTPDYNLGDQVLRLIFVANFNE